MGARKEQKDKTATIKVLRREEKRTYWSASASLNGWGGTSNSERWLCVWPSWRSVSVAGCELAMDNCRSASIDAADPTSMRDVGAAAVGSSEDM